MDDVAHADAGGGIVSEPIEADERLACLTHDQAIQQAVKKLNAVLRAAEDAGFDTSVSMILGGRHREVKASASVLSSFAKELRNGR